MRFRKQLLLLALCALFLAGCGNAETAPQAASETDSAAVETRPPAETEAAQRETTTVMVYMTGSDLEASSAAATKDMEEMAQSGIDLSVTNLLVYTGGAEKWHSDVPEQDNSLFYLTDDGFEPVASFEQLSMGDPDNLARFLSYGAEHFPAGEFELILWDHGNGPVVGYGLDKQYDNDTLTLPEMRAALEQSPFGPENRLGFIGFDACLMSSAELACTLADYADYMIASQETEPSFGWNYDFLARCGSLPTKELAMAVVDAYFDYCEAYFAKKEFFRCDITLAVTDLSLARELGDAVDGLFAAAASDVSGDFRELAVSRVHTRGLGRASTGSEYDLVDLESLAAQMAERYPKEADAVRSLLEGSVVYSRSNAAECCGLSLFYPFYNKTYYQAEWEADYRALELFPQYVDYLERYQQIWLGSEMQSYFTENFEVEQPTDDYVFTLQLTPEQQEHYAEGTFYLLRREKEDLYTAVVCSNHVTEVDGLLTATFDGKALYYEDDLGTKGIPVARARNAVGSCVEYALTYNALNEGVFGDGKDSVICEIQISVDTETDEVVVKGIYDEIRPFWGVDSEVGAGLGTGKRQEVELSDWNTIMFASSEYKFITRDENGRILGLRDWDVHGMMTGDEMPIADGLHFIYAPLYEDGKDYFLLFDVMDVQGTHYASELFPVALPTAPEHEKEAPKEVAWEDGNRCTVLVQDGITFSLAWLEETGGGAKLYAVLHNDTKNKIQVRLSDLTLNDAIIITGSSAFVTAQPGETVYKELQKFTESLLWNGLDRPETIGFSMGAYNADTYQTLVRVGTYRVVLSDGAAPQPELAAFRGAGVRKQTVYEENGLRVSLESFGMHPADKDGKFTLCFDNQSETAHEVSLLGLCVNGVYIVTTNKGISHSMTAGHLQPGERCYVINELKKRDLDALDFQNYDEAPLIPSISSLSVVLYIDDTVQCCPVALETKGVSGDLIPTGETLYEDERIRVVLFAERVPESTYDDQWYLWVVNLSDDGYQFSLYTDDDSLLGYGILAPGAITALGAQNRNEISTGDLTVHLRWSTRINDIEAEYQPTEPFVLPVSLQEGGTP